MLKCDVLQIQSKKNLSRNFYLDYLDQTWTPAGAPKSKNEYEIFKEKEEYLKTLTELKCFGR